MAFLEPENKITLPTHTFNGESVPVCNPSVSAAKNNLGLNTDENVFLAYQAFEQGVWNTYLRHIRFCQKNPVAPFYISPYNFSAPEFSLIPITGNTATYVIVDLLSTGNNLYLLMSISLSGLDIYTGESGDSITEHGLPYNKSKAYIELSFNLIDSSCGDSGNNVPWSLGDSFISTVPPAVNDLGWTGDENCVEINFYPNDVNQIYTKEYTCSQIYLLDDPYCPTPYLELTYHPEDMYTLSIDDRIVSRVVYHMSLSANEAGQIHNNNVDFMFVIDHSGSMTQEINTVRNSIPHLARKFSDAGVNARYGCCIYGRGDGSSAYPLVNPMNCSNNSLDAFTFDGLDFENSSAIGGFTTDINDIVTALDPDTWGSYSGEANTYQAIQFSINSPRFSWRENVHKFIFVITDTSDDEGSDQCPDPDTGTLYVRSMQEALNACQINSIRVITALKTPAPSNLINLSSSSGWSSNPQYFSVEGTSISDSRNSYVDAINVISDYIILSYITQTSIVERNDTGYAGTFIEKARVLVTYDRDLTDIWSQQKQLLRFNDNIPAMISPTKNLTNYPYDLYTGSVFGIDPVHLIGEPEKWVYFDDAGAIILDHPNIGVPTSGFGDPILIAANSTRPKVVANNRNDVFVIFESYNDGIAQIEIKGTGDFAQNSICGPKANRITSFLFAEDFSFNHKITMLGEGVNQLCDIVIDNNDVVHITWQSNRDGYWEIYYANAIDLFSPIRVTTSNSRSGYPSIDIDSSGSVFIVYNDNRFGPYEIMMSYKNENRTIPLLEQDPYLSSLAESYIHYTNVLPVYVQNLGQVSKLPGQLFATKTDDDAYGTENYIFALDDNGNPVKGGDTGSTAIVALAGSTNGSLFGITEDFSLLLIDQSDNGEDPYVDVDVNSISIISSLNISSNSYIMDAAHDYDNPDGYLWIMIADSEDGNLTAVRIIQVNKKTGETLSQTTVLDNLTNSRGGIAISPGNIFWMVAHINGVPRLYRSAYPYISGSIATFNFQEVATNIQLSGVFPQALTVDHEGSIYTLCGNTVALLDTQSFSLTTIYDIPTVSLGDDPFSGAFPLNDIRSFAYHFSGKNSAIGSDGYFHIRIEFFDNINREGSPHITVDSRNNLDAFIGSGDTENVFISGYFAGANGVYLPLGASAYVLFDASLFSPNRELLANPYGFDINQTYFPVTRTIDSSGNISGIIDLQQSSFSCNRCNKLSNNISDYYSCAYSFVLTNNNLGTQYFNMQVLFFADKEKQFLLRTFSLTPGHVDLKLVEVNNESAESIWTALGLPIQSGDSKFIQIYPAIDQSAGFLCGLNYYVIVQECNNSGGSECSDFANTEVQEWGSFYLTSEIDSLKLTTMTAMGDRLGFAWNNGSALMYAELDEDGNVSVAEQIEIHSDDPSLAYIDGSPAVAYINSAGHLSYARRVSPGNWDISVVDSTPLSTSPQLRENSNGNPAIVYYAGTDIRYVYANDSSGHYFSLNIIEEEITIFSELGHSYISGVPHIRYPVPGPGNIVIFRFAKKVNNTWLYSTVSSTTWVPFGHEVLEVEGKLFTIGQEVNSSTIKWATGTVGLDDWLVGGTIFSSQGSIQITRSDYKIVKNRPVWAYAYNNGNNTFDIRVSRLIGNLQDNQWETVTVVSGLSVLGGVSYTRWVTITNFLENAAVFHGNSPAKVYIDAATQSASVSTDLFFCECASSIFDNRIRALSEIGRWISSAQGYADTRITDSVGDSLRPQIKARSSDGMIITFEDYNDDKDGRILGSTFFKSDESELFGSGTQSWFDYNLNIDGRHVSTDVDLFDRLSSVYERKDQQQGKGLDPTKELPSAAVYFKNCDFNTLSETSIAQSGTCDYTKLLGNIITRDPFISSQLIKKIEIHPDYVEYFTYNSAGKATPVVEKCNVVLQIWGSPEVVAVRLKNENETTWSEWCPTSAEISNYYVEKNWTISSGVGIKEICAQVITYNGITAQFCLPIIADYTTVTFEIKLYEDEARTISLPLYDGLYVANTGIDNIGESKETKIIYVEILPNKDIDEPSIRYDVLQQGSNDLIDLLACKVNNSEGKQVYIGQFNIGKEDLVLNKDGLARIRARIPGSCDVLSGASVDCSASSNQSNFNKDTYNLTLHDIDENDTGDVLSDYRQTDTGRIGVDLIIRPSDEDPYLIFGDPDYFLRKSHGDRN